MSRRSARNATCPICKAVARPYCRKEMALYYHCGSCDTIFQDPMPTAESMAAYVDQEYSAGRYKDYVEARDLKLLTFRERAKQIVAKSGRGRLLDVGCACGFFVEAALEAGFDAHGLEISPVAIEAAPEVVRPRLVQGDVNHLVGRAETPFDVVTAFDIIEHTFDPIAFLESLTPLLRPGGLLVLTTPDTRHFLRYAMGKWWPMLQPMQHTILFSPLSASAALRKVGFTSIEIVPARKVLTADYLSKQVSLHEPVVGRAYGMASRVVPSAILERPVGVNIGEIMVFATWSGA
jgi:SAM-dependent methyltransferase